jgi:hypothetical protein
VNGRCVSWVISCRYGEPCEAPDITLALKRKTLTLAYCMCAPQRKQHTRILDAVD